MYGFIANNGLSHGRHVSPTLGFGILIGFIVTCPAEVVANQDGHEGGTRGFIAHERFAPESKGSLAHLKKAGENMVNSDFQEEVLKDYYKHLYGIGLMDGFSQPPGVFIGLKEMGTGLQPTNAIKFDGFESGDLTAWDWTVSGVPAWNIDGTKPYEGSFSAHVKTADIPNAQDYSSLDLVLSLENGGFVQFYFNAQVAMPFESFELWVDGSFLTPLMTPDPGWMPAGAILSGGDHTVSWRYANNPGGLPDDVINTIPKPPNAEVWFDNVALLPLSQSFVESWESQDFSTNHWILSGDANWTITDAKAQDGTYSATVSSSDIASPTGSAKLSIVIITENGGTLTYWIMPSVVDSFDSVNVSVNDIVFETFTKAESNWVQKNIVIQPGKREVIFELQKAKDGQVGEVWLDNLSFAAN